MRADVAPGESPSVVPRMLAVTTSDGPGDGVGPDPGCSTGNHGVRAVDRVHGGDPVGRTAEVPVGASGLPRCGDISNQID